MENIRIFLVTFSETRHYILCTNDDEAGVALVNIEKALDDFIARETPSSSGFFAVSPKIVEVAQDDLEYYPAYPALDESAIRDIMSELRREMRSNFYGIREAV